nr:GAF domain-containing protein [Roseovarius faecimaris]
MIKNHADRVFESVRSSTAAARSAVAASWRRSFDRYGLDPSQRQEPRAVDESTLLRQKEAAGHLMHLAEPRLDELYGMIAHCGAAVFLTDRDGVVLSGRARPGDQGAFREWGLEAGRDWSEAAQGTNGIGTCLAERRALIIHRDEHFMAHNTGMSCIDAPVFGADGALVAALDVSSARADQTESLNQLIAAMVTRLSIQLETDLFRAEFSNRRILMTGEETSGAHLLAVDSDDIVVGASRAARQAFGIVREGAFDKRPLRDLTGEASVGLQGAERSAVLRAITRAGGNLSEAARELGIGRATLYRRMKRLGISER